MFALNSNLLLFMYFVFHSQYTSLMFSCLSGTLLLKSLSFVKKIIITTVQHVTDNIIISMVGQAIDMPLNCILPSAVLTCKVLRFLLIIIILCLLPFLFHLLLMVGNSWKYRLVLESQITASFLKLLCSAVCLVLVYKKEKKTKTLKG